MSVMFKKKAEFHDHLLKQTRLVMEVKVVANATPANKQHIVDVPGMAYLRTQGKTAEADAVEDISAQVAAAANDANGVFAVLLDEQVSKIYSVAVTPSAGTATITGAISTGGRMILNLDSNQDLSTTDLTCLLVVEYKAKNAN